MKTKPIKGWRFCAYASESDYNKGSHFLEKHFTDFDKMKTFSAKHSAKNEKTYPNYVSMYWRLDKPKSPF